MRVEAELLREDADSISPGHFPDRTQAQRAADAVVRLFQVIGECAADGTVPRARVGSKRSPKGV